MREPQRISSRQGGRPLPLDLCDLLDQITLSGRSPALLRPAAASPFGRMPQDDMPDLAMLGRAVLREAHARTMRSEDTGGRFVDAHAAERPGERA